MAMTHQRYPDWYFGHIADYGQKLIEQGDREDGQALIDLVDQYEDETIENARLLDQDVYQHGYTELSMRFRA